MAAQNDQTSIAAIERHVGRITILIMAGWAVFMLIVKFRLAHHGLATDDLYNYANASTTPISGTNGCTMHGTR